jgi:hypothetical protein
MSLFSLNGAAIAGLAVIARHRRDRKTKTSPLINADDTDQERGRKSQRAAGEGAYAPRSVEGATVIASRGFG